VNKAQLYEVALEIARMLDDAIVDDAEDGDLGPMVGARPDPTGSPTILVVLADGTEVMLKVYQ
jgi:hypothetical protein